MELRRAANGAGAGTEIWWPARPSVELLAEETLVGVWLLVGSRGMIVPSMTSEAETLQAMATGWPLIVRLYSGTFMSVAALLMSLQSPPGFGIIRS